MFHTSLLVCQCVIFISVIVILSLSCICAVVIFSVEATVPLCNNFTVSILCDNLISMQQVTQCLVA